MAVAAPHVKREDDRPTKAKHWVQVWMLASARGHQLLKGMGWIGI